MLFQSVLFFRFENCDWLERLEFGQTASGTKRNRLSMFKVTKNLFQQKTVFHHQHCTFPKTLSVWWYYIFLKNNKSTCRSIGTTISLVKGKMIFWSTYKFCLEIFYVLWIRFGAWNCLLYLVSSIFNSYSICSRIMTLLRPSMENDLQSQALKV